MRVKLPIDCEGYKGEVEIKAPSEYQIMKYVRDCNFKIDEESTVSVMSNIESTLKMYDIAREHVSKVEIKKGTKKIKSFDELINDPECNEISRLVTKFVITGGKLSQD